MMDDGLSPASEDGVPGALTVITNCTTDSSQVYGGGGGGGREEMEIMTAWQWYLLSNTTSYCPFDCFERSLHVWACAKKVSERISLPLGVRRGEVELEMQGDHCGSTDLLWFKDWILRVGLIFLRYAFCLEYSHLSLNMVQWETLTPVFWDVWK